MICLDTIYSTTGEYKENLKESITITVSSDSAHQIDLDTGAVIVEVEQPNGEQTGSLTVTTDEEGKAVLNNLPLGSYYLKETTAGEHFVLNTEMKEFALTAEDDTQAVAYVGVAYEEIWEIDASYEDQNIETITFTKEIEN